MEYDTVGSNRKMPATPMNAVAPPVILRHNFNDLTYPRKNTAAGQGLPLVMWTDVIDRGHQDSANHHHDFYSLYVVRRGRGTHVIDGQAFGVARGDVYAMAPGMTHYFVDCHDMVTDTFHFSPSLFDAETLDALSETDGFHALFVAEPASRADKAQTPGGRWLHLIPAAHHQVSASIEELRAEWERGDKTGALLARGLFFRLLVTLARAYAALYPVPETTMPNRSREAQEPTIAAALRFMEDRFTQTVRVDEIARAVFLSPDRFTEVFAQSMGRTPRDYLRYLRVERAKALLQSGTATMTEVAQDSGFGDPAYFARAFRSATGVSPTEWKKLYAAAI